MTWPRDGLPLDSIWDVRARLAALQDPWTVYRVRAIWLWGGFMRRKRSAGSARY